MQFYSKTRTTWYTYINEFGWNLENEFLRLNNLQNKFVIHYIREICIILNTKEWVWIIFWNMMKLIKYSA